MENKYVRQITGLDIPELFHYAWGDRNEVYKVVADIIREKIIERLVSMPKPYLKLASTVVVRHDSNGVEVEMDQYGKYLDLGTDGHFMISSIGKSVPIKTETGEVVIRKVTADGIAKGKWYNPGIKALNFVEEAIDGAFADLQIKASNVYKGRVAV